MADGQRLTARFVISAIGMFNDIALPDIQNDLGFTYENLQWVLTAYTLAFGGFLLLGGRAGDILGRRRVFIFGIALFTLGSLGGGFAWSEGSLLAFRAVQGLGAAIAAPTALSLIATEFPEGKERNRAMGVYAARSGAGAAIGLILGGFLTEIDWRWVMFVNVPIGLFIALVAPRALTETERHTGKFDLPGAITATAGLALLVYAIWPTWEQSQVPDNVAKRLEMLGRYVYELMRAYANPAQPSAQALEKRHRESRLARSNPSRPLKATISS